MSTCSSAWMKNTAVSLSHDFYFRSESKIVSGSAFVAVCSNAVQGGNAGLVRNWNVCFLPFSWPLPSHPNVEGVERARGGSHAEALSVWVSVHKHVPSLSHLAMLCNRINNSRFLLLLWKSSYFGYVLLKSVYSTCKMIAMEVGSNASHLLFSKSALSVPTVPVKSSFSGEADAHLLARPTFQMQVRDCEDSR